MPEDRFRDLGSDAPSAAERLADLDEREPEPDAGPPAPRRAPSYTWVVGVAAVILIAVVAINSLPNAGRGIRGPEVGTPLPRFAAPGLTSDSEKPANLNQGARDERAPGETPACAVRERGIVNSCDVIRGRPAVVTVIVPGPRRCEQALDGIERVRREFPGVAFIGVVSGRADMKRKQVADLARRGGWRFPVAIDRGLQVFNLYRVGVCPTTVLADGRGVVRDVRIDALEEGELRAAVRAVAGR